VFTYNDESFINNFIMELDATLSLKDLSLAYLWGLKYNNNEWPSLSSN